MDDIFSALRHDHDTQRTLLETLVETQGASDGRDELFARTRRELQNHAMAEERHFYVPLMQEDLTQEKARHSVHEHEEIDELVNDLESTDPSSPAWLRKAGQLKELVEHHLEEEEQEVFQLAGRALNDDQKRSLAAAYAREKAEADGSSAAD